MTHAQLTAYRIRRWLLVLGLTFEVLSILYVLAPLFGIKPADFEPAGLLGTPLIVADKDSLGYLMNALVIIGLLFLAQWAFLRPGQSFAVRLTEQGRPMRSAVIVAAAMMMLLALGVFGLALEIPGVFERWHASTKDARGATQIVMLCGMAVVWALWGILLFRYWKDGDRYTQLGRMVRALVAGSMLEAVIAAPVQAHVSRQTDCYCERGSYLTLICSGAVLFWAFGPGIVLLYFRENHRRMRLFPH